MRERSKTDNINIPGTFLKLAINIKNSAIKHLYSAGLIYFPYLNIFATTNMLIKAHVYEDRVHTGKFWLKFKDFSRTSQDYFTVFKDKKVRKNTDRSAKILLQKC